MSLYINNFGNKEYIFQTNQRYFNFIDSNKPGFEQLIKI